LASTLPSEVDSLPPDDLSSHPNFGDAALVELTEFMEPEPSSTPEIVSEFVEPEPSITPWMESGLRPLLQWLRP
jgi:hypothetical protein